MKKTIIIENAEITDVAAEGKAIAKDGDLVIFVPYAVPGDVVDLQLTKKKKNYAEAKVVKFHKFSDKREEPFCPHYGICGGCKWQILPYAEQLRYKQKQVCDNLTRIGKLHLPPMRDILGSEQTVHYRNKLEYTFSSQAWLTKEEMALPEEDRMRKALGFHIPGKFDKVLHITRCALQDDISDRIRNRLHEFCEQENISYFDIRRHEGMMRNLIIRNSAATGELMVIVCFYENDENIRRKVLEMLDREFPEITSLLYVHNNKANDTITDLEVKIFKGKDHIYEKMEDLKFKIGPKSFYQTNSRQAYWLYSVVRDFANLQGFETVYDLYTGTGTIANFVARKAAKVIGIEYVKEAIDDAKINSTVNGLENTDFYAGDMKDILTDEFVAAHGHPDVLITDPPRAGMHPDVVETILKAAPARIVYVSCNPATQARDLAMMSEAYSIEAVQPVDMFPHTQHVENVVLLQKK